MDTQKLLRLRSDIDAVKSKQARAEGAHEQAMATLAEEYGCDSIEEAKTELGKRRRKETQAQDKLDKAVTIFNEKWGTEL